MDVTRRARERAMDTNLPFVITHVFAYNSASLIYMPADVKTDIVLGSRKV